MPQLECFRFSMERRVEDRLPSGKAAEWRSANPDPGGTDVGYSGEHQREEVVSTEEFLVTAGRIRGSQPSQVGRTNVA